MPSFAGVDHLSLSVTDLNASQRFYVGVLGFMLVVDLVRSVSSSTGRRASRSPSSGTRPAVDKRSAS